MSLTLRGVGNISWGSQPSAFSASGSYLFEDLGYEVSSDFGATKNGLGTDAIWAFYNTNKSLTFTTVPIQGISGSITGSAVMPPFPNPGDFVSVTDPLSADITSTTWVFKNGSIKGSNTTARRMVFNLMLNPNITQ